MTSTAIHFSKYSVVVGWKMKTIGISDIGGESSPIFVEDGDISYSTHGPTSAKLQFRCRLFPAFKGFFNCQKAHKNYQTLQAQQAADKLSTSWQLWQVRVYLTTTLIIHGCDGRHKDLQNKSRTCPKHRSNDNLGVELLSHTLG